MTSLIKKRILSFFSFLFSLSFFEWLAVQMINALPDEKKIDISLETKRNAVFYYIMILRLAVKGKSFNRKILKNVRYYNGDEFLFAITLNMLEYTQSRYYNGFPDPPLRDLILKGGDTFIDIGANVGIFSLLASTRFNHVYAFEVQPETLESLNTNTGAIDNIKIMSFGLSSEVGSFKFYCSEEGNGGSSLEKSNVNKISSIIEVPIKTLDSLDIAGKIDLIKIDVEGHELEVLKGAKATIGSNLPQLFMETHDPAMKSNLENVLPSKAKFYNPWNNTEGFGHPDTLVYWDL